MTDMQSVSPTVQKNGHIDLHNRLLYLCERIESGDLDGENLLVEGQELEEIKGVGRKLASLASFEGCDIIAKFLDIVTLVGEVLSAVGNTVDEMESAGVAASDTDQPGGANDEAADDVHGAETPTKDRIMENVTEDALAAIIRSAFAHRQSLEREYLAGCCEGFAVDPNLPLRMLKRNLKLPDEIRAGMGPETTQTLTKYTELLESPSNTKAKYACSNGEKGESELVDGVTTMEK